MNEREAMAILVSAQAISYAVRERALRAAGSALNLLDDPKAYVLALGPKGVADLRAAMRDGERLLDQLNEDGISLLIRGEAGYPQRLAQSGRPPHLLFCRGTADLCDPIPIGIVGTRGADAYGLRHTRRIAGELARAKTCVVSGMALGIDAAAHEGALNNRGRTIAVLGSALDKPYPLENIGLMRRILDSGGSVVSEYPPGVWPTRYSFLQRNRIIAGLSLGVLVTQAPMRSGAMSTATCALEDGREVFAMPGDIDRLNSQLPNHLIAEGAHPVACGEDIMRLIVVESARPGRHSERAGEAAPIEPKRRPPRRSLDAQEQQIVTLLETGDLDFDALCEKTGMPSDELGGVLMMLELDGIVQALPGMTYRLE